MQPGMMPPGAPRWPHPDWNSMKDRDPEMFRIAMEEAELERRTGELGMQFRGAPEQRREEIKKELTKLVNHHFEIRQQRRELELKRLEKEIQRLREAIERRTKARDELVNKRVRELLGDREDEGF
jgi:septal ring factor EnvC (AmiA/AmiB activator)